MPIIDDAADSPALPPALEEIFKSRVCISYKELQRLFGVSEPTARAMVQAIGLPVRQTGIGTRKRHRVFTLDDVQRLMASMEKRRGSSQCQTYLEEGSRAAGRTARGDTGSKSTVIPLRADAKNRPVIPSGTKRRPRNGPTGNS
jgi:hypothetical protein